MVISKPLLFAVGMAGCVVLLSEPAIGGTDADPPSPLLTFPDVGRSPLKTGSTDVGREAIATETFLTSLGIGIHHAQGVGLPSYIQPLRYLGVRNIRDDFGPASSYITLNRQTGVKVNLVASTKSLPDTIAGYRKIAENGALLSIEGPNEPNNFPITYKGQTGGGLGSWQVVAEFQRDLFAAVKADEVLRAYPVFHVSEAGAQTSNVGLQFLQIPLGTGATLQDGTRYADYANTHNYVSSTQNRYVDNQAWHAADPTLNDVWDGLYGEYGKLWGHGYSGYSNPDLIMLPRVSTETGWDSKSGVGGERVQGIVLLNTYLAQFRRGWRHTFIYMLRDGEGGDGNQGVFNADSSPKLAATYIHNLTAILADRGSVAEPARLRYELGGRTNTVHDLLLQNSNGDFQLVVWNERVSGSDEIRLTFGRSENFEIFDPTQGSGAIETHSGKSEIVLSLTDHPIIITIRSLSRG